MIQELKEGIKNSIDQIEKMDLSVLYPDNPNSALWQNMTPQELEIFIKDVFLILKEVKKNINLIDLVGFSYANNLNNRLINLTSQIGSIQNLQKHQISNQHHAPLNEIEAINNVLRNSGIYNQIKILPDLETRIKSIKDATKISQKIIESEGEIISATESAKNWLSKKNSVQEKVLEEHASSFISRKEEHSIHRKGKFWPVEIKLENWKWKWSEIKNKIKWNGLFRFSGNWWWILFAIFCGCIVGIIIFGFLEELRDNSEIGPGAALLRISSLIVPSYFTFFCVQQFEYHKKMYETYCFKDTSLNTISELTKLYQHRPELEEKILVKGLDVIFSEPKTAEDKKGYDKQLINQLISMIKPQSK